MGKNFSCNNVDGKRKVSDFYETPYGLTRLFLDQGLFNKDLRILEPAAGDGAIVRVLDEYGFSDIGSYDIQGGMNFLHHEGTVPQIITNPPFSIAYEFVMKAKQVATRRFAFLLPLSYLHGKQRFDHIWQDKEYPLRRVYVFTRYPLLGEPLREDGKSRTGMMVYSFFYWEKAVPEEIIAPPTIHWLDNNHLIVGKGD